MFIMLLVLGVAILLIVNGLIKLNRVGGPEETVESTISLIVGVILIVADLGGLVISLVV